jgi:type I pantothenate kinase
VWGVTDSRYLDFDRAEWGKLRGDAPVPPAADLTGLAGLGDVLPDVEIEDVYVPLAQLIGRHAAAYREVRNTVADFLDVPVAPAPYVIGIAGSVAVGKSTTARVLRELLAGLPGARSVDLVTTDGFLYTNAELERRDLMTRKGFPESYDRRKLIDFLVAARTGASELDVPVYSHLVYDVVPGETMRIAQPDMLIVEGLNLLQLAPHDVLVSDLLDFTIYVDADEKHIRRWYIDRFLSLRTAAFADPHSFFHRFAALTDAEAIGTAGQIWDAINHPNLVENILPTRGRARLILEKGEDHLVRRVRLRRV